MSKKYLTGSRRLQIIQRWLNGVDDPNFDVFPTRKEGKYIVKPRKTTMTTDTTTDTNNDSNNDTTNDTNNDTIETTPEQYEQPKITPKPKQIRLEASGTNSVVPQPKSRQQTNINNQSFDPTINIEILNQLKLLGEEFKLKREKKEQKRMIKEVVQKQIAKPRMQYNYTEPDYSQQQNQDEEMIEHPQPTLTRRRNNIFADIM